MYHEKKKKISGARLGFGLDTILEILKDETVVCITRRKSLEVYKMGQEIEWAIYIKEKGGDCFKMVGPKNQASWTIMHCKKDTNRWKIERCRW